MEQDGTKPKPSMSALHVVPSQISASKGWFDKFHKRFRLTSISLHINAASVNIDEAEAYVNNKFKVGINEKGHKPD